MQHGKLRKSFEWKLCHELDDRGKGIRMKRSNGGRIHYKKRNSKGIKDDVAHLKRVLHIWKRSHPDHNLEIVWSRRKNVQTGSDVLPHDFSFSGDCPYVQTFEDAILRPLSGQSMSK